MVLNKLDQTKFPFFRGITGAAESDVFNNNCYNILTLEVSGTDGIALRVQGCVNIEDSRRNPLSDSELTWFDLAVIDAGDFSVSKSITKNGIYSIGISGTTKIRVVADSVSGSLTAIGVLEA